MIHFKRFTESTWLGYQGAEHLKDGSEPYIGYIKIVLCQSSPVITLDADVIVTDKGIDIYADEYWFRLLMQETSASVLLRLEEKMTDVELQSLGFNILTE